MLVGSSPELNRTQAYRQILGLLLSGEFDPNQSLSERSLAEAAGLGRMPVREALKDLEREQLITVVPGKGTFVRELTLEEVQEIYEVRYAVEGLGAYLAAQRGPTTELRAFRGKTQDLLNAGTADLVQLQAIGTDFHDAMCRAARNRELVAIYGTLSRKIALSMRLSRRHDPDRIRASAQEHLDILDAIEAGDPDDAQRRIWRHLSNGLQARVQIFSKIRAVVPPAEVLKKGRGTSR